MNKPEFPRPLPVETFGHEMRVRSRLPIDEYRECLRYDPETGNLIDVSGHFRVRYQVRNRRFVVARLGWRHGKEEFAYRVAWAMTYGYWPHMIDHINGNSADDRLVNLREVDASANRFTGPSGGPGVVRVYPGKLGFNRKYSKVYFCASFMSQKSPCRKTPEIPLQWLYEKRVAYAAQHGMAPPPMPTVDSEFDDDVL